LTAGPAKARALKHSENVIAGGPDKFAQVRRVVLRGSNFEIGRKIGELAKRDGISMRPSKDTILNRAQREYLVKNYPILHPDADREILS